MSDVSVLQEAINHRADRESRVEADKLINMLPRGLGDFEFSYEDGKGTKTIKVQNWVLMDKLRAAVRKSIRETKIQEYSNRVLALVDEVDYLKESVQNLESNQ